MDNIKTKLDDVIVAIDKNTNLFYQDKTEDGYNELTSTLTIIEEMISDLSNKHIININDSNLLTVLGDAMNAMENKDALLLADILQYELKEIFTKIKESLL